MKTALNSAFPDLTVDVEEITFVPQNQSPISVITSYSIHYTKLYEDVLIAITYLPLVYVITSYSIHYTKLYENIFEYLSQQSINQQSQTVYLPFSKKKFADYLGVQRPDFTIQDFSSPSVAVCPMIPFPTSMLP